MATIHVAAERLIRAEPARVYGYLADYRVAHPAILPPAFSDYRVDEGGTGDGTIASFTFTAGGRAREMRVHVTEPEPGRRLMERDEHSGLVTNFTVTPEGGNSRVRFATTWERGGLGGILERLFAPMAVRRIYDEELANLDAFAREHGPRGQDAAPSPSERT